MGSAGSTGVHYIAKRGNGNSRQGNCVHKSPQVERTVGAWGIRWFESRIGRRAGRKRSREGRMEPSMVVLRTLNIILKAIRSH